MRAGTLVHSFGSMYLSPMIPIYLRNGKGNGGKFLREVGKDEMLKWMQSVCPENMEYPVAVWHGFVGAAVTKDIFLIENPIIYNAIYHHVLGTSQDPYAMMVFCADKLDPLRGYDSTKLIEICNKDIKEGFDLVVQQNREYLKRG